MPRARVCAMVAVVAVFVILSTSSCGSRVEDEVRAVRTTVNQTSTIASTTTASTSTSTATSTSTSAATSTTLGPAATTTIDTEAAIVQITANWEKFFLAGTPLAERVALLENGSQYVEALTIRAADPLQAQASAEVRVVELTDALHAHVVYDVLLGGTVALPAAEGNAVRQDGTWKVSADSFCSLISLGATEPIPGCS